MTRNTTRVLIIEDEKPLAHALELKLRHDGIESVIAHDGEAGLAAARSQTFDVILLDLMMPVMDGFQVLSQLQKTGNTVPVFVLSNLSQREDEDRVASLGASRYFIKSNTPLAAIVEEIRRI